MGKQNQQNNKSKGCRPESLFGTWFIEPERLEQMRARVAQMDLAALAERHAVELADDADATIDQLATTDPNAPPAKPYAVRNGVAVLNVNGPTTKYETSFQGLIGGTSTRKMERYLSLAKADPDVKRAMIHFEDAPGGTVAGAYELRDAIRAFAKVKPIDAHISDLGASAAYLFAAATGGRITANQTAFVGSIGTRANLIDSSEKYKKEGIKVIPVAAGKYKAAGMPGTEITDEHVAELQKSVDKLNEMFIQSVADDRKLTPDHVRGLEARTFIAQEAVDKKLIDGVCSFDDALAKVSETKPADPPTPPTNHGSTANMELLAQLRATLNQPNATEAEINAAVAKFQTDLAAARAALPKQPDPEILASHLELAVEKINLAVDKGTLPVPVADELKRRCGAGMDGKAANPSAYMLTKAAALGDMRPVDFIVAQFADTKIDPEANKGAKSGVQKLDRQIPGDGGDQEDADLKALEAGRKQGKSHAEQQLASTGNGQK